MPIASLIPLLWPAVEVRYALEPAEERVLVRLGANMFEKFEYDEETVDAFEDCRAGSIDDLELSTVCDCRKG